MTNEQFADYERALNTYVANLPSHEERIKASLAAQDRFTLQRNLEEICYDLRGIFANDIVDECWKHVENLERSKFEKVEAYITYFLASVSMLSIDIQMISLKQGQPAPEYKPPPPSAPRMSMPPRMSLISDFFEKDDGVKKILAVDDAALFLNTLKSMLNGSPYKVTCVNSGELALKYLENNRPNLLILDIEMPGMNGYELAAKIRAMGQMAPIIYLTGNYSAEYVKKAVEAGAADFITKPINKKYVLERIAKYIDFC